MSYRYTSTALSNEELKEIESYVQQFYELADKKNVSPQDIDELFEDGRRAYEKGEVSAHHVSWVCGTGLGDFFIKNFHCEWQKAILEDGTEIPSIVGINTSHYIFPISSFEKRIDNPEDTNFAQGLVYLIERDSHYKRRKRFFFF